ncbi:MAG: hypothetical protein NVSMB63_01290 [Sediminibacterium sp.]
MSLKKINPRTTLLLLFITLTAVLRLFNAGNALSPLANFTPIGAMALFGGTYFKTTWKRYFFPLLALFASDVVMMKTVYAGHSNGLLYAGWYWTYIAFAIMVLIGQCIKKVSFTSIAAGAVAAALAHWIITDTAVWMAGGTDITTGQPYTRDLHGLVQCHVLAIPFMKNMLIANLVYGGILFGGFEYIQKRYPSLRMQEA